MCSLMVYQSQFDKMQSMGGVCRAGCNFHTCTNIFMSWHAMRPLMLTVSALNLCCQNNNNFPGDAKLVFRKVTECDAVLTRLCVGSTMAAKIAGIPFSTRRERSLLIHRTLRAETSKRNPSRDCGRPQKVVEPIDLQVLTCKLPLAPLPDAIPPPAASASTFYTCSCTQREPASYRFLSLNGHSI